jgi:hypothetical protein
MPETPGHRHSPLPMRVHHTNMKRVLPASIMRTTRLQYLCEQPVGFVFCAFCGSSWADDPDAMCSAGGYFLFSQRGQGAISSKSFVGENPVLSSSSAEAECARAAEGCKESLWVQQFLLELDIFKSVAFEVLEDSQPRANALKRNFSGSRFRRVRIYYHFIRDAIRNGWCAVVKIGTGL